MRSAGDDVRVRYRRRMRASGNEPGKVCHVYDEERADLISNLAHAWKIEDARIGAASAHNHLRLLARSNLLQFVIVNHFGVLAHAIGDHAIKLAGKIQLVPVGQMAAVGKIEAENRIPGTEDGH